MVGGFGCVVGAGGDRAAGLGEDDADRLDTPAITVIVDERDNHLRGRSSSAVKKEAEFGVLLLQLTDALDIRDRLRTRGGDLTVLYSADPTPQCFGMDVELSGDTGYRTRSGLGVLPGVDRHPRCAVTQLRRVLRWARHGTRLPSGQTCLHQTRVNSVGVVSELRS